MFKLNTNIMSEYAYDLSLAEQQSVTGGQYKPTALSKMPNVLVNGFPLVPVSNPYTSPEKGKEEAKINAHNHNSSVILD